MIDALRQQYRKKGYVVLKGAIPTDYPSTILGDVERVFRLKTGPRKKEDLHQLIARLFHENFPGYHGAAKLCNHLVSLHQLGLSEPVVKAVSGVGLDFPSVCARPVMWFHSPLVAKSQRYEKLPPHQEWSNMQGSLDGVVVWTPLVEVSTEMGKLEVIPGSHKYGLLPFGSNEKADYPFDLDEKSYDATKFVPVDVDVGDLLLFSSFLIHRSGINRSDRIRLTANFRFNNATEQSFVNRDFLNPYLYEVASSLHTPDFPATDLVRDTFK